MGVDHHLALLRLEQQGVHIKRPDAAGKAGAAQQIDMNREALTPVTVELQELATLGIGRDFQDGLPQLGLKVAPIVDGP